MSISLDLLGDRWSLLIVRDLMVRGYRFFQEFLASGEGIATNILSDRLGKLEAGGIVFSESDPADGRKVIYRLSEKGIDLAPVLLDLLLWAAKYEETGAPCALIGQMAAGREAVLAEVRRRWETKDPQPLLPRFSAGAAAGAEAALNLARHVRPRASKSKSSKSKPRISQITPRSRS